MATLDLTAELVEAAKRLTDEYLRSQKFASLDRLEDEYEKRVARWLADLRRRILLLTVKPAMADESEYAFWMKQVQFPRYLVLREAGGIAMNFEDVYAQAFKQAEDAWMGWNTEMSAKAFTEGWDNNKDPLFGAKGFPGGSASFAQQNTKAAEWAEMNAAYTVKNINGATTKALHDLVSEARQVGESYATLARKIATMPEFDAARAKTIAVTETAKAYEQGARDSARLLHDAGIPMEQEWLTHGQPCEICAPNKTVGWIPLDTDFPSGHHIAPAHPNCRCSVTYRRAEPKAPAQPQPPAVHPADVLTHPSSVNYTMDQFGMMPDEALRLGVVSQAELELRVAHDNAAAAAKAAKFGDTEPSPPPTAFSHNPDDYFKFVPGESWTMENWGKNEYREWAKTVTMEQQQAIDYYQGAGYGVINSDVKAGRRNVTAEKIADALKDATVPENVTVYRGATDTSMKGKTVGDTIERKTFTSTSLNTHTALDFLLSYADEQRVIWKILVPGGTKGAAFVEASTAKGMGEAEVLMNKGTKWRIVKDDVEEYMNAFGDEKFIRTVTVVVVP